MKHDGDANPTPFEGWEHGGTPKTQQSVYAPRSLSRSKMEVEPNST